MKTFWTRLLQMAIFVFVGVTAMNIVPDLVKDGVTHQEWFVLGLLGLFTVSACIVLAMLDDKEKKEQ